MSTKLTLRHQGLAVLLLLVALAVACGTEGKAEQTAAVDTGPSLDRSADARDLPTFPSIDSDTEEVNTPPEVKEGPEELKVIWEAWTYLTRDYVDQEKLDPAAFTEGAIRGMLAVLEDPQTVYIRPDVMEASFTDMFRGDFEGIGAHVQITRAGKIVIVSPIEGSPAQAAGIRPGDIILAVNGEDIEGMSLLRAVSLIRGPKGSDVTLTILHLGALDPVDLTITRGVILLPSVLLRSEPGARFAHIRLTDFFPNTIGHLQDMIQSVKDDGAEGLILDLRNNPGGPLESVVDVASQFLDEGIILSVVRGDGRRTDWKVRKGGIALDIPMVVLVNKGSGSSSEVLAGALQDHNRATIIGATTFGKGSVNILRDLTNGGGLYITVALWYTPLGRLINHEGITPDLEIVDRDPEQADVKQLQAAIEELSQITGGVKGAARLGP